MVNFELKRSTSKCFWVGDPYLNPTDPSSTKISHVLIYDEGDAIFYAGTSFNVSWERGSFIGLKSSVRIMGLSEAQLKGIGECTGIPLEDLVAIQTAERKSFEEGRVELKGYLQNQPNTGRRR